VERSRGPFDRGLGFRSRSRRGSRSSFGLGRSFATAASRSGAAAATTIAATIALAVATAVATGATMAAPVALASLVAIATAVATLATVARRSAATTVTTIAAVASLHLRSAANQSQTDDRENDRDTKRKNTIHPRCLLKQVALRKGPTQMPPKLLHPLPRRHPAGESNNSNGNFRSSRPARCCPDYKLCRLRRMEVTAQLTSIG
jgi:hypothetical protein